jgi:hypothetical protein
LMHIAAYSLSTPENRAPNDIIKITCPLLHWTSVHFLTPYFVLWCARSSRNIVNCYTYSSHLTSLYHTATALNLLAPEFYI